MANSVLRALLKIAFVFALLVFPALLKAQPYGRANPFWTPIGHGSTIPSSCSGNVVWIYTDGTYRYCVAGTFVNPFSGSAGITSLNGLTGSVQTFTNDTNVIVTSSGTAHALGWSGTLAAGRLNSNVVQGITNDTNITGSISGQNLTFGWSGSLAIARGGTGATSASGAFNNLSPLTTLGDTLYGGTSGAGTRLAGNTTAVKKFLCQTGTGSVSAAPSWCGIAGGDLPASVMQTPNPSLATGYLSQTYTVGTGGVTANTIVKTDSTNKAIAVLTSDTGTGIGIALSTVAASGTVEVAQWGMTVTCVADNNWTQGNLIGVGTTTAGSCKDLGTTSSTSIDIGIRVLGTASVNVTAGGGATGTLRLGNHIGFGRQISSADISGPLAASLLPNPSSSSLGGVQSYAAVSHQWINAISNLGVPSSTQPTCSDLSGVAASCATDATNMGNASAGTLALARGGTNAGLTADAGAIPYSTVSAIAFLAHTTTAGLALLSGNAAAPTWSASPPGLLAAINGWSAANTNTINNLGTAPTASWTHQNTTAAAIGAQQYSPYEQWCGNGWKTTATAGSQTVCFVAGVVPAQGATNPTGSWVVSSNINGAGVSPLLQVNTVNAQNAPLLSINNDNNTGWWKAGIGQWSFSAGNNDTFTIISNRLQFNSAYMLGWSNGTSTGGSLDTTLSRNKAGFVQAGTTAANASGGFVATEYVAGGSSPSTSGCGTTTSPTGGMQGGTFTAGASSCTTVLTFTPASPTGWECILWDKTAATGVVFGNSSDTTTTATFPTITTASGHVMGFKCQPN